MSELVTCALCKGQKGWGNYPPMNNGDWTECPTCFGTGKIELFTLLELEKITKHEEITRAEK